MKNKLRVLTADERKYLINSIKSNLEQIKKNNEEIHNNKIYISIIENRTDINNAKELIQYYQSIISSNKDKNRKLQKFIEKGKQYLTKDELNNIL